MPALDGGITVAGASGTRVGDSVVVAKDGFQYLTDFPRQFTGFLGSGPVTDLARGDARLARERRPDKGGSKKPGFDAEWTIQSELRQNPGGLVHIRLCASRNGQLFPDRVGRSGPV